MFKPETIQMYEEWGQNFIKYVQMYWLAFALLLTAGLIIMYASRFMNNKNRHS